MKIGHAANRGPEIVLGVLGRDAALDGRAARRTEIRNVLAGCNPKLLSHQIASEANLGHRMLDLQARVDLEEVELAILEEELDGAGALISDRAGQPNRRVTDSCANIFVDRNRGRFLDELLMAALNRAFAFTECDDFAVAVAEDLHLDVTRSGEILLDENSPVTKCRLRLMRRGFRYSFEGTTLLHNASRDRHHRLTRLTEMGYPAFFTNAFTGADVGQVSMPGTTGTFASTASRRAATLSPTASIADDDGPTKNKPGFFNRACEGGAIGKKSVAGMNRILAPVSIATRITASIFR